jgi:pimeloyl-ACP methyl ester carboxylesterase
MKTLILLHGALGSKAQVEPLMSYLGAHYETYVMNFHGHGGLPIQREFSMDSFVDDILAFYEQNNIQKASFFGYSMGGYVALKLAIKYPEKVDKIITLGTKFNWTPDSATREIKMLNPKKIMEKVPKFGEMLSKRHAPQDWKINMKYSADMMLALGNGDAVNNFSSLNHTITLGIGTLDNMVTLDETQQIAHQIPNATLWQAEGFKHPIEQVDIRVLAQKILDFV